MNAIFPLFVVWPLATGTVLFLLRKRSALQESLSTLALVVNLILAVALLSATADGTIFVHRMGLWPFPYAIVLAADRLTATLLCLSASIVGACAVFARSYLTDAQRKEAFHPLLHFLLMGIQGCFITGDLFNLFVFIEVMLMATYALMGFYYNLDQLEMAFKYTCLNLIASALFPARRLAPLRPGGHGEHGGPGREDKTPGADSLDRGDGAHLRVRIQRQGGHFPDAPVAALGAFDIAHPHQRDSGGRAS